ncbi:hypothetical protein ACHQM5_014801 [Ranunculus cassubicifolius]
MDNLYESEGNMCQEDPEKFKRQNKKSFNPKHNGGFVKGPAIFMVTDDLEVEPFSTISSISFINKLGVPLSDLEERSAHVGEQDHWNWFFPYFMPTRHFTRPLEMI